MKLALLGDIHGNSDALAAVLDGLRREQVNQLLLTGDFVGYYYHPEKVLRALEGLITHAVRGNHEDMLFSAQSNENFAAQYRARYGSGVDIALSCLSEAEMDILRDLPVSRVLTLDGKQVLLGHGAPWDTDYYIYPNASDEVWQRLASYGCDYVVLGHTHYRYSKRIGNTLVINPGSVGQPRDRQPGAAWALLDTEADTVTFFTEEYALEPLAAEARIRDPHLPYLVEVLTRR